MGQSEDLALCVVQKERDRRQGRRTSLVYTPRIYAQIIGVVLILMGVVGCGAGGGSVGGGGGAEDAQAPSGAKESVVKTIRVKETEFVLKPAEITLEKPGTYLFKAVNSGGTVHALEVEGQGIEEETEEIQPGQSAELKVKLEAGTYELYCPVDAHKEEGMEGKVIVKEGSGGSGGY
jgi:plastocyanin